MCLCTLCTSLLLKMWERSASETKATRNNPTAPVQVVVLHAAVFIPALLFQLQP